MLRPVAPWWRRRRRRRTEGNRTEKENIMQAYRVARVHVLYYRFIICTENTMRAPVMTIMMNRFFRRKPVLV